MAAIATLQANHELVHDEEIWIAFTEQIVLGMGGDPSGARACATEMVREWERHENFSLYEDALPVLDELRRHDLKIGLISNGQRDLEEFAEHHVLEVDAVVGSKAHGRVKPHASIFVAALRGARRGTRRDRDGRRLLRGRHRGRASARDPRDPARPRRVAAGRGGSDRHLLALPAALGLASRP